MSCSGPGLVGGSSRRTGNHRARFSTPTTTAVNNHSSTGPFLFFIMYSTFLIIFIRYLNIRRYEEGSSPLQHKKLTTKEEYEELLKIIKTKSRKNKGRCMSLHNTCISWSCHIPHLRSLHTIRYNISFFSGKQNWYSVPRQSCYCSFSINL